MPEAVLEAHGRLYRRNDGVRKRAVEDCVKI